MVFRPAPVAAIGYRCVDVFNRLLAFVQLGLTGSGDGRFILVAHADATSRAEWLNRLSIHRRPSRAACSPPPDASGPLRRPGHPFNVIA